MSARIRLLLSSYVPLFIVGALRFNNGWLCTFLVCIAVGAVWSLVRLVRVSKLRVSSRKATPTSVRDRSSEVAAYVATYLLPLMTVADPGVRDLIAYAFVLVTLGVVFVNSDLVGVNPLLSFCGYRVFRVSGVRRLARGEEADTIVISRYRVVAGTAITLTDLATGVSFVVPQSKDITID